MGVEGSLDPPWGRIRLRIEQRIGIEVGAESMRMSFGDAWSVEALQFVTQLAVAPLRRVEIGKPLSRVRRHGCFG